jgi:hypothetical protein
MKNLFHNVKCFTVYLAFFVLLIVIGIAGFIGYQIKPIADVALLQCVRALSDEAATIKLAGELDIREIELKVERESLPKCVNKK